MFIACCALALTYESFLLLHLPVLLNWYLLLVFLCTVFVYCLHYFVKLGENKTDDRLSWCRKNKILLLWIILSSLFFILGGVIYHFNLIFGEPGHFNYHNLAWFIIIPALALSYSYPLIPWNKKSLRQIGWLKMISLSFIWSFTTVALPVLMLPDKGDFYTSNFAVAILFLHRFFFISALSFLFNINDYEEDKQDDIKTLAVIMGQKKSLQYGKWIMTIINAVFAFFLLRYFELQELVYYIAVFLPVIMLFLLYQYFSSMKNKAAFVIRNDGLMLIKALLLIFALIILT